LQKVLNQLSIRSLPMPPSHLRLLPLCLLIALGSLVRAEESPALPPPAPESAPAKSGDAPPPPPAEARDSESKPAEEPKPEAGDATTPAPEAPKNVLTKAPSLKRFVEAPYPAEAEKAGLAGAVLMEIDIGADGKVGRAVVTQAAGHGFDEAAIEAVKQFEFDPAEIDNVPAAVRVTYRYEFVLRAPPPPPPAEKEKPAPGIVNFEGQLVERGTRAPIKNGGIQLRKDGQSFDVPADLEGKFQFKDLPAGKYEVVIVAANFERYETTEEVQSGQVTTAKYYLRRKTDEFSTTVRAPREKKEIARRTLTMEEIQKIPGTQGDAIRVVQNLPGVARTPLGLGPLIVRGGRPGDTRTYVDGMLVPVLFHFLGIRAVVNSDMLDTLDFYPGNPPARYGRSLSGAVDINTRAGKRDRYHGYADISLLEASAFMEGPLTSKGSFMASVRRSYIDAVLPLIFRIINNKIGDFQVARYWDYQLKTDFDFGRDQVSFFLFGSSDRLQLVLANPAQFSTEGGRSNLLTEIGFHRFNAAWKRKLTKEASNKFSVTLGTGDTTNSLGADLYGNLRLDTLFVREDLNWEVAPKVQLNFGADLIAAKFTYATQGPPPPTPGQLFNPVLSENIAAASDSGYEVQPGVYAEAVYKPFSIVKLIPSLRFDYDTLIRRGWVDPRITAMVDVAPTVTLKAAVGQYHQPPSPEKLLPKFGNPNLHEEGSTQYAVGVDWRPAELWDIDFQVYYKDLYDQVPNGFELLTASSATPAGLTNSGTGRAYGVELLLRRQPGKSIFGWLAVSLGQVERRLAPTEPLVQGYLNQRFNVVGVVSYKAPFGIDLGLRWQLTDGNPTTPMAGGVFYADADRYMRIPNVARLTSRLPPYSQIDFRIDRKFVFQQWILNAYLDILNVSYFARKNIEGANPNYNYTQTRPVYGIPIFPAFGIRGEF
jgi:TonB family protein